MEDNTGEWTILNNLGGLYQDIGKTEKGLQYFEKALSAAQDINDDNAKIAILSNIGGYYQKIEQYDKAVYSFKTA